jgi:hypothetical protein
MRDARNARDNRGELALARRDEADTMKNRANMRTLVALVIAMTLATACIEFKSTTTGPSSASELLSTLSGGLWSSAGTIDPSACGNFKWSITELTSTSAKGTFGATCNGGITLNGTAEGTLSGSVLNWKAAGTANTAIGDCPFTLNGTALLEGVGVRVNYTANTCVGTFTGSELLKK